MYPFLNTDYNTSTRKDVVWVNMWAPAKGLKRGTVVAFWYVMVCPRARVGFRGGKKKGGSIVKGVG